MQFEKPGEPSHRHPRDKPIPLHLINGVATVWDAQVAAIIHCTHAISGLRTGTLPGVSQQNGFLGLPLTLMQEETAFLVRSGIAHLVPVLTQPTLPSPDEIAEHTRKRIARIRAVEEEAKREEGRKAEKGKEKFEMGGEKARLKREARARIKAEKEKEKGKSEGGVADDNLFGQESDTVPSTSTSKANPERPTTLPVPSMTGYFHEVPALSSFPSMSMGSPITSLPHPSFPFPSTPRDRALVDTFTKLHSLDLRMGLGPRFGGEYLIYPGDYLRYHAHFTSQVLIRDECIRPSEIVAWGRLGTGTKKAGLICCWDDEKRSEVDGGEKGEVDFYSLEWANFG